MIASCFCSLQLYKKMCIQVSTIKTRMTQCHYSTPVAVQSIVINWFVCVSVYLSVWEHISGTAGPICTKFCIQIPCGRGSVLLWRRCDMLCTPVLWMTSRLAVSACTDSALRSIVHFVALRDRGGVWCLWMHGSMRVNYCAEKHCCCSVKFSCLLMSLTWS